MPTLFEVDENSWAFNHQRTEDAEKSFDDALAFWDEGALEQAEQALRVMLRIRPDDIDVWHHLGLIHDEAVWKRLADHASKIKIKAPSFSEVPHEAIRRRPVPRASDLAT